MLFRRLGWDIKLPADRLEFLADMIQACRAYVGVRVRKKFPHPPLVPEFQLVAKTRGLVPEFCSSVFQPGSRLPACMPLPTSCVCHPRLERIPAGSKVLRAVFHGGMTGASLDLRVSDCSAMSVSSDFLLSDCAGLVGSSGLKLSVALRCRFLPGLPLLGPMTLVPRLPKPHFFQACLCWAQCTLRRDCRHHIRVL